MITTKTSGSDISQHSPLTATCLYHHQVGSSSSPSPQSTSWSKNFMFGPTQYFLFTPNCQSPYKETTIHQNAWVINCCNCQFNRMSFRYVAHSTSWWTPPECKTRDFLDSSKSSFIEHVVDPVDPWHGSLLQVLMNSILEVYALQINRDTWQRGMHS